MRSSSCADAAKRAAAAAAIQQQTGRSDDQPRYPQASEIPELGAIKLPPPVFFCSIEPSTAAQQKGTYRRLEHSTDSILDFVYCHTCRSLAKMIIISCCERWRFFSCMPSSLVPSPIPSLPCPQSHSQSALSPFPSVLSLVPFSAFSVALKPS